MRLGYVVMIVLAFVLSLSAGLPQAQQPADGHDGEWQATTSQNKKFRLTVKDSLVSEIEFQYSIPGGKCFPVGDGSGAVVYLPELQNQVRVYGWSAQYAPKVQGNKVAVSRTETSGGPSAAPIFFMEGTFESDGTLSGTIQLTALGVPNPPVPPCQTSTTVTFRARRGEGTAASRAAGMAPGSPLESSFPPSGETRISVRGAVQATKLVESSPPEYPPTAKQAHIQGVVRLNVLINKQGRVTNSQPVSGHPLLFSAAQEAVKKYVYQPTLINGQPVEVATQVDVTFTMQ